MVNDPKSFRFNDDTIEKIKYLAKVIGVSQTDAVVLAVDLAYRNQKNWEAKLAREEARSKRNKKDNPTDNTI